MPKYQYQCTECAESLEIQQSFSDAAMTVCPACGGRLRKVFNAVGVVFKGSGFYRNDSRPAPASSGESTKPAAKDGAPSTTSSSPDSGSSPASAPAKKTGTDSAA